MSGVSGVTLDRLDVPSLSGQRLSAAFPSFSPPIPRGLDALGGSVADALGNRPYWTGRDGEAMTTDVAIPESGGELTPRERQLAAIAAIKERANAATSTSFDSLLAAQADNLDVLITRDVREKESLVGVPFIITGVTFNPGKNNSDFVSLEITPQDGDPTVINDGGTGIRRQVVQWLTNKGMIDPGLPVATDSGEVFVAYDNPIGLWRKGQDIAHDPGFQGFNWLIPRGTRVSTYNHPEHGESETWYLS